MKFRKKPVVIDATQWFKNGDHPLDHDPIGIEIPSTTDLAKYYDYKQFEGKIVRRFRHPDVSGGTLCRHCLTVPMHDHGWIETLEGGHIVCPGDWIITGVAGETYPCKPAIFAATYDQDQDVAPDTPAAAAAPQECWSADEEDFNSTSLGELIDCNCQLVAGSTVWVGEAVTPDMSQLCSAQDVLDTMADRAGDIAGEHADDYPDASGEAMAELNTLLAAWMARYCPPHFYTVTKVRPYMLTTDDIAPHAD